MTSNYNLMNWVCRKLHR